MNCFDLKVGYSCNNNCIHCVVADKRSTNDLTTQEIKKIIRSRSPEEPILFTGGEPTIRNDFIELIKYTKNRGHLVTLQTNGTQFSNFDFTKEASKYLDHALIAIHSHKKEIHDKIVQCEGMYEKTIKGLKNLVKMDIKHDTQTVISKLNIPVIKETFDFIQSISPSRRMTLTFPHAMGNAYKNWKQVVPKYSDIREYLFEALVSYGSLINIDSIPPCYLCPFHDNVINFDEVMRNDFKSGKMRQGLDVAVTKDLIDDYNFILLSEKMKAPKCKDCVFDDRCSGVWKEYFEFYGDDIDLYPVTNI
jgi:MoaA/NifB/PqqE/SkfB family radical SAM enzyme